MAIDLIPAVLVARALSLVGKAGQSIWVRPFAAVSFVVIITVTGLGVFTAEMLHRLAFQSAYQHLGDMAEFIAAREATDPQNLFRTRFPSQIETIARDFNLDLAIFLSDGTIVAQSNPLHQEGLNPPSLEEFVPILLAEGGRFKGKIEDWRKGILYVVSPIQVGSEFIGFVRIGSRLPGLKTLRADLFRWIALWGVSALFIILLVGLALSHKLTSSLREIAGRCRKIAAGDLQLRINTARKDEIGLLADTIDEMAIGLSQKISESEEARNRFEVLLSLLREAIVLSDKKGHIVYANSPGWYLFHQEKEAGDLPIVLSETIQQTVDKAEAVENEFFLKAGMKDRHYKVYSAPLCGESGEVEEILLVIHDDSDVHAFEELRREFSASISHELKTPIAAISALVEALQDSKIGIESEQADYLLRIERQNNRLLRLVRELLAISKLDSGKEILSFSKGDLSQQIRGLVDIFAPVAEQRKVELKVRLPQGDTLYTFDQQAIELTLNSLVDNALRHTLPGGKVEVILEGAEDYAEITVSDTGKGISAEHLNRIFERFYRVDLARSPRDGGSGLGLSIVKHFTQAHGGTVSVYSEVNKGTTFSLYFGPESHLIRG